MLLYPYVKYFQAATNSTIFLIDKRKNVSKVKYHSEIILYQLIRGIMAGLIIALPFAMDRSLMFPTQSAKYFLFGLVMIGILSFALIEIILTKKHALPQTTQLDILLALFFLYSAIRVGIDVENFGVTKRFVELTGLAALYLVLRRYESRSFEILLIALLLSDAAQAIYGNLQLYGIYPSHHSMFKITGGFFNPGPHGGFLAIIFPIALVTYLNNKCSNLPLSKSFIECCREKGLTRFFTKLNVTQRSIFKYISLLTIISILLILPATRSRAAWMAVLVSCSFILADRYNLKKLIQSKFDTTLKRVTLVVSTLVLLGTASTGLYAMKKGSADGRLLIWKVTSNMIRERPLFGFGYDHFKANYLNYQADYFNRSDIKEEAMVADNTSRAINEYMQITAEGGIIGLLFILSIIWSVFFSKLDIRKKSDTSLKLCAWVGIISFGVFALFSYPTEILPIKACLIVCFALMASYQKYVNFEIKSFFNSEKVIHSIIIIGSLVVLFVVYSLGTPFKQQYQSIQQWKQAYLTYQMGAYEASHSEYCKVYEQLKNNGNYLVNYGKACSMAGEHNIAIDILTRAERFLPNTIAYTAKGDSYKALGKNGRQNRHT